MVRGARHNPIDHTQRTRYRAAGHDVRSARRRVRLDAVTRGVGHAWP
jgi:hypothetical protein